MKFRSKSSNRENGPTFLDFPLFPVIFQWDEQTKHFPISTEPKFPKILTKWKVPLSSPLFRNEIGIVHSFPSNIRFKTIGPASFLLKLCGSLKLNCETMS